MTHHKGIVVFDLDGTTLDSSHRQLTLADGRLDLEHWIENSKPAKVLQDSILPLGRMWARMSDNLVKVICTARVMDIADYKLLYKHGLSADFILSRPQDDRGTPDDLLKVTQLHPLLDLPEHRNLPVVMFDDSAKVRSTLRRLGIPVIHPKRFG